MATATFPKIDYRYWLENCSPEGFSSMKRMITTMINKKYIDDDINETNITNKIKEKIKLYLLNDQNELLFDIFKLIQTWGGKSSGKSTLNMVNNWDTVNTVNKKIIPSNSQKYKKFVTKILGNQEIDSFDYMIKGDNKIVGLSYSFIPKHICFWSGKGERTDGLPILDDVIAKIVYKVNWAYKIDYKKFIIDMDNQAQTINLLNENHLTLSQIEIALFSFAGNYWDTGQTATVNFKKKPVHLKNLNEANEIANEFKSSIVKANRKPNSKSQQCKFVVSKQNLKIINDTIFLSKVYVNKNNKISNFVNKKSFINIEGIHFYEFIDKSRLIIK